MSTHPQSEPAIETPSRPAGRRSDEPYGSLLPVDELPADPAPRRPAAERAPRIAAADVFQAADALLVQGHRPTIDRVRMRLGRGSPNTINEHLDTWWANLGARISDLAGSQFPQLPERIGKHLQLLWAEALQSARDTLGQSLAERERALSETEKEMKLQRAQLTEAAAAGAARADVIEESISLARLQFTEANRRAAALEEALRQRDGELARLRERLAQWEAEQAVLVQTAERERAAHRTERAELDKRHEAAENRWFLELDRTRQALEQSERQREHVKLEAQGLKSELKLAVAVRAQLEARLRPTAKTTGRLPARRLRKLNRRKKSDQ